MLCKMRYMDIPQDSVKPLEYYAHLAKVGESKEFDSPQEVEKFVKDKFSEGWQFMFKIENETGLFLYFKKVH